MKIIHKFIILICSVSLFSCSSVDKNTYIAGSSSYFPDTTHKVLSESLVSGLRVRLVRLSYPECHNGYKDHIELHGPIGPDSTYIVKKYLEMASLCWSNGVRTSTAVYMHSNGGLIRDGVALGNLLRREQASTRVVGEQQCASSCAIAFLGGRFRSMSEEASLLFHAPYITSGWGTECISRNKARDLNQYFIKMIGKYQGNVLFDRMMSYCDKTSGWTVNSGAAQIYGLTK